MLPRVLAALLLPATTRYYDGRPPPYWLYLLYSPQVAAKSRHRFSQGAATRTAEQHGVRGPRANASPSELFMSAESLRRPLLACLAAYALPAHELLHMLLSCVSSFRRPALFTLLASPPFLHGARVLAVFFRRQE